MSSDVVGAAVSGGASVLGSLIGGIFQRNAQKSANKTNLQIARETNAQNYQIFREQNEFNKDQFNQYLQYNTPAAQRARFEEAGINPYLAMNNVQAGNANSALSSANAAPMQAAQVQPENGMAMGIQNAMMNAAAVMNAVSDANLKNQQANRQRLENASFAEDFANRMEEIRSRIGLNKSSKDLQGSRKQLYDFDFKFRNDTLANAMKLSDLSVAQGDAILQNTLAQTAKVKIETDVMNWDLGLKKKYDEQFLKGQIANLVADVLVKYQNISESKNRMRNDNARVGIERQNANTNAYNAQTNRMNANTNAYNAQTGRMSVEQQGRLITAQVSKIYSDKYGVDLDNKTRGVLNQKVIDKMNEEIEKMRNQNYTPSYIRQQKESGSLGWNLLDAFGYGVGQIGGNLFGGIFK